jgi:hypothetical protein
MHTTQVKTQLQTLLTNVNTDVQAELQDLIADNINNFVQSTVDSAGFLVLHTTEPVPALEIAELVEELDNLQQHLHMFA